MAVSIFWHRRDLRLHDNAGLYHALKGDYPVVPIFIFDRHILDKLEDKEDARVAFIHEEIEKIQQELKDLNSDLQVYYGYPEEIWKQILKEFEVKAVYTNRDYEPYAKERDKKVKALLQDRQISFKDYKDHILFDHEEVVKNDGDPYTVFTPYKRKWLEKLASKTWKDGNSYYLTAYPNEKYQDNYHAFDAHQMLSLSDMGFKKTDTEIPDKSVPQGLIKRYAEQRNFPAADGTSRLGVHFRFGTISIRQKALKAQGLSDTFLSELIWRDFYSQILYHFPHVADRSFRPAYDDIQWRNDEQQFEAWCEGKTGYPLVDAGMRELNATGYMHNRVRMVVASFLTKHLLIDWRWGEAYFAKKLLDFDLASNNGGWQWAAGSGTDAAPYFRIFNPASQLDKFDKDLKYVKRWVPEYGTSKYPKPIVDHKEARERCLETYKEALK